MHISHGITWLLGVFGSVNMRPKTESMFAIFTAALLADRVNDERRRWIHLPIEKNGLSDGFVDVATSTCLFHFLLWQFIEYRLPKNTRIQRLVLFSLSINYFGQQHVF